MAILVGSSLRGCCMKILQVPCVRGACMKAFRDALGRFLYQELVRSSPAEAGRCMTILWDPLRGPGMKVLVKFFYNSLWEDLIEIPAKSSKGPLRDLVQVLARRFCGDSSEFLSDAFAWSCRGPCEKILKRSWWNPLYVLAWSRMGPCVKILWRSCWNPLQEALAWRSSRCSDWCLY